ncbi:hypothetical protein F0P96_00390 [Hymenobacter busanensis]|uniref:Novel STAND NTPase 1 domain-containing protein n=1 Tax=Hymenobacter busanensis TaxID=2607656 RepID=A0A7L4ZY08_9BACT|nr:hypothetical protein [Hymenobacter busanensis]KAA9339126.1 hypothetical protein F0P96_00390 [Hymenobacter busanensis]QHJ07112.1 hypothetical protein GUY19_07360 [Hymenobacter busanensis]
MSTSAAGWSPTGTATGVDAPVCPYTGLRTFTEDEAIYFRGRESHIERCIEALADQHFIMITGASGDGKSSLVFAGVLPEIRAGFFRSKYSNWTVCTFRPERNPLHQMARAVAEGLQLGSSVEAVETELGQGFSSLVQLYQNSALCPPEAAADEHLTDAEKRRRRVESANLLVVVDQFEEFFTNAENYDGDTPNLGAQTVVNLLLETARLAREQKLPIYIVCTMRSDYIGQCADFRGLVELIGESQYFVPRLLRHEFVEVIKEPALLSGNRIADRLVQRLVNDNRDGRDQLPVLQHALYQIWLAADSGREEMDLLHYAMVGGMPGKELPWRQEPRFKEWRNTLSVQQQQFLLAEPSLHNVLDAHANQLYASAGTEYNARFAPPLPEGVAQHIIEQTFRCLTKVDASRVVRNRMTGAEITAIINDPAITWPVVCRVLIPFRRPGNTFISPFIAEGGDETECLPEETVLDITHESLIRNWNLLKQWAREEAEDVTTVHDLAAQAQRWHTNGEATGFLLPIGPYTYFAQWFERKRPNAKWLAYYVEGSADTERREDKAAAKFNVLHRFLETSRRNMRASLLIARYGAGRLAAAAAAVVGLVCGLYVYQQWRVRQADYVAYSVVTDRLPALHSSYVDVSTKADMLINTHRLRNDIYTPWLQLPDTARYGFSQLLNNLANDTLALDIELQMFANVRTVDYAQVPRQNPLALPVLLDIDQRIAQTQVFDSASIGKPVSERQRRIAFLAARYVMACAFYLNNTEDLVVRKTRARYLKLLHRYLQQELAQVPQLAPRAAELMYCIRVLLSQGKFTRQELFFLDKLNPYVAANRPYFNHFFPSKDLVYQDNSKIQHAGGYLVYAGIATALHQESNLLRSLDSVRVHSTPGAYANSGNSVLPLLIKHGALTEANVLPVLKKCAAATQSPLALSYSVLVYHLLSTRPTELVLQPLTSASRGRMPADINADLASFSIGPTEREKTWRVLAATKNRIAAEPGFLGEDNKISATATQSFADAFFYKMRGIYLQRFLREQEASTEAFRQFSGHFANFNAAGGDALTVNGLPWSLMGTYGGIWFGSSDEQDATDFLLSLNQPYTASYSSFLITDFTPFFTYLLGYAATQPQGGKNLVEHLERAAYADAALPFAKSFERHPELKFDAYARDTRYAPNATWLLQLNARHSSSAAAAKRTEFLRYVIECRLNLTPLLGAQVKQYVVPTARKLLAAGPSEYQTALEVGLIDLAVELVLHNRITEAMYLVNSLPGKLKTMASIRVGEQMALQQNTEQAELLAPFVRRYDAQVRQDPRLGAPNAVMVLSWLGNVLPEQKLAARSADAANFIVKEGFERVMTDGVRRTLVGQVLADEPWRAWKAVPAFLAEDRMQRYCNSILQAVATENQRRPYYSGWKEYDENGLLAPRYYIGNLQ